MKRTIENLLNGRRKNKDKSKSINFDETKAILEKAQEKGVKLIDADMRCSGGHARSKQKSNVINTIESLDTFFAPGSIHTTSGEFIYRTEFEGDYVVYSGKLGNEKHYLDVRCLLWGGNGNYEGKLFRKATYAFETS